MIKKRIPNYGYVPFKYFQYFIIGIILIIISKYESISKFFNFLYNKVNNNDTKNIENNNDNNNDNNNNNQIFNYIKTIFVLIPLILFMYYDLRYSSFSFKNLGITKYISNDTTNYVLRIIGALGIIQVLAQDIGVKTGIFQRNFVQLPLMQFLLYFGTAFAITNNRSEAMVGSFLYFILKYGASSNKTSRVCFEEV